MAIVILHLAALRSECQRFEKVLEVLYLRVYTPEAGLGLPGLNLNHHNGEVVALLLSGGVNLYVI